jgi:hypothetical protein
MISSIQHRKANVSLKEDTLTSSVFDFLLLLPDNLFWEIIKKSCYQNNLPRNIKLIESYDFWPRWYPENTAREKYVEPDLFIRFDNFDLIIEAKRWDDNQQYIEQWKNEFIAYKNEYGADGKNAYLMAMGGIDNENEENINVKNYGAITVVKCRWNNILGTLINILNVLEKCKYLNINNIIRNIDMVINCLEMHGFIKIHWLEETVNNYDIDFEQNFEALNNWRIN